MEPNDRLNRVYRVLNKDAWYIVFKILSFDRDLVYTCKGLVEGSGDAKPEDKLFLVGEDYMVFSKAIDITDEWEVRSDLKDLIES